MSYLGKLSPVVGNGLGGLPRRDPQVDKQVCTILAADTEDFAAAFSYVKAAAYYNSSTSADYRTSALYFDDNNIAILNNTLGAINVPRFSINKEVVSVNQIGTYSFTNINVSATMLKSQCVFDILSSSTKIASSDKGVVATLSGSSISIQLIVPTSGITTVNSYSYSINTGMPIKIRKTPSGYVVIACQGSLNGFLLFKLSNTFNIEASTYIPLSSTTGNYVDFSYPFYVSNDGLRAYTAFVNNQKELTVYSVDISTLLLISTHTDILTTSYSNHTRFLTFYDKKTDSLVTDFGEVGYLGGSSWTHGQSVLSFSKEKNKFLSMGVMGQPTSYPYKTTTLLYNSSSYYTQSIGNAYWGKKYCFNLVDGSFNGLDFVCNQHGNIYLHNPSEHYFDGDYNKNLHYASDLDEDLNYYFAKPRCAVDISNNTVRNLGNFIFRSKATYGVRALEGGEAGFNACIKINDTCLLGVTVSGATFLYLNLLKRTPI